MIEVKFSNGLTLKASSMAQVRRWLQTPVRGRKIVAINGKPVEG